MLKSPLIFAISVLVAWLSWTAKASATEKLVGLSFELPPVDQSTSVKPASMPAPEPTNSPISALQSNEVELNEADLIRPAQPLPPLEIQSLDSIQASLAHREQPDIGVQFLENTLQRPTPLTAEPSAALPADSDIPNPKSKAQEPVKVASEPLPENLSYDALGLDDWIFEGGSQSLVAHTVGSAEGTRHWDGAKTNAYYGHVDPGNGVWNLGTFSYQHEASSPEEADEKQIKRLKYQGLQLEDQAAEQGIELSLVEKLNGLDLANQAPLAALGEGGYIERLVQARRLNLPDEEAIAWARTRAYIDPNTRTWNAPGLGNTLYGISKDQARRMSAIDKALRAYNQANKPNLDLASLQQITLEGSNLDQPKLDEITDNIAVEFELSSVLDSVEKPVAETTVEPAAAMASDQPELASIASVNAANAVASQPGVTAELESADPLPESTEAIPTAEIVAVAPTPIPDSPNRLPDTNTADTDTSNINNPAVPNSESPLERLLNTLPKTASTAGNEAASEASPQAAQLDTEIAIPAPLTGTATEAHGIVTPANNPKPSQSLSQPLWRTEDKVVRSK